MSELTTAREYDDPAQFYDFTLLRQWREQAGLTATKVAADLDISYSWLDQLERGRRVGSVQLLTRLANHYGHQAGELMLARPA